MCVVSMVTDHYQEKWPANLEPDKVKITLAEWFEYQELKKKAVQYDIRTRQPHCEKPGVDEWEQKIVEVLLKRGLLTKGE
jgi:hypothetical protein